MRIWVFCNSVLFNMNQMTHSDFILNFWIRSLLRSFKTGFKVRHSYCRHGQVVLQEFSKPRVSGLGLSLLTGKREVGSSQRQFQVSLWELTLDVLYHPKTNTPLQHLKIPPIRFRQNFMNIMSPDHCSTFLSISLLFLHLSQDMYCLILHNGTYEGHRLPAFNLRGLLQISAQSFQIFCCLVLLMAWFTFLFFSFHQGYFSEADGV